MRRFMWVLASAAAVLALAVAAPAPSIAQAPAPAGGTEAAATRDVLTFKNGRVVEGKILEVTASEVKIEVITGTLRAVTTYPRAEILTIERDVPMAKPEAGGAAAAAKAGPAKAAQGKEPAKKASEGAAKVALITLKGEFGRDISLTPIKRALDDAVASDPDVIVIKMDATQDERYGFDGLFVAERMLPPFEETIRSGKRVVFWIKRAMVGAAFLPFVSKEIYFLPEGRMGGVGTLQDFDMGDKRVNEKQISLRLGHAEGIAIQGGYDPALIKPMARKGGWLAVNFRGGKPEYMSAKPSDEQIKDGWIVLVDDGEGPNKDTDEQIVRGKANDVLNFDADMALRLNVSKGTAEDLDKLVFVLGLGSEHTLVETKSQKILDDWSKNTRDALDEIRRLRDRIQGFQPKQGEDPKTALGRRASILREMRSVLTAYEEVFDPEGQQRAQIDENLEQIKQQIAEISKREREQKKQR